MGSVVFKDGSRFDLPDERELNRLDRDFKNYITRHNLDKGNWYQCRTKKKGNFERTFVEFAKIDHISFSTYHEGIEL